MYIHKSCSYLKITLKVQSKLSIVRQEFNQIVGHVGHYHKCDLTGHLF